MLVHGTHEGFVPGPYLGPIVPLTSPVLTLTATSTKKQFSRIVFISQGMVFQFLKEVLT